jgi:phosphomannomutase/phosphoglucomutase
MSTAMPVKVAPVLFKAYDIRGIVDATLTVDVVRVIGQAIASDARERDQKSIVIGRDGRLSGPAFIAALADGIRAAGLDVIDIGQVATPMVYYASHELGTHCGVMITGSHNPPDYNGLKMVIAGEAIHGERIQSLYQRIVAGNLHEALTPGGYEQRDVRQAYLSRILSDVRLSAPMRIAIDCGNGVAGDFAPELYERMGAQVTSLFCEVDGTFPNHHPDPAHPENLQDLIACLAAGDAELGLAFDGDGDRLGVVTKDGQIIYPDRQLMLFAEDVLKRNPGGTIIYDVKCTRNIAPWVLSHGGVPMMWKTGHSLVKARLRETGAPLAGEMSGHIFFKDRWYGFDDGMYAGARLLEILSRLKAAGRDPSEVLNALPNSLSTPELHWELAEGENFALIDELRKTAVFPGSERISLIDGLRVEYPDGFGLARSSNTTPVIVLRFEADSAAALARIQADFRRVLLAVKPDGKLPF